MSPQFVKVKTKAHNLVLIDIHRIVAFNITKQFVFVEGDGTPFELSNMSFANLVMLVAPFHTDLS